MFGLDGPELIVLVIIVVVIGVSKTMNISKGRRGEQRRCLACQYAGSMKTWLGNYNLPQIIALILLFCYLIPGLIFIGWGWGKYKCPKCGALAKSVPVEFNSSAEENLINKKCPFCAEDIKLEAIVCKHCGRDLPVQPVI